MLWDILFLLVALTLAAAGWTTGIVNSWRGPFAMIFATLITQRFYIDFSTWIVQQLRTQPEAAVALGFTTMWIASEIVIEVLMSVIPLSSKHRPNIVSRILGAVLGCAKAALIFLLPLMALQVPITIPVPPKEKIPISFLMVSGVNDSMAIVVFRSLAKEYLPTAGKFVVSTAKPSFTPNFVRPEDNEADSAPKEFFKQFGKQRNSEDTDQSE
jgi:hypothetical protein